MPALRQVPAGHARHVDEDFAATALDQVPAEQRSGADPREQKEPAMQDTQELLAIAPVKE